VAAAQAIVALLRPPRPVPAVGDTEATADVEPIDARDLPELAEPWPEESTQPAAWVLDDMEGEASPSEDDLGVGAVSFRGEMRTDLVYKQAGAAGGTLPDDAPADAATTANDDALEGDADGTTRTAMRTTARPGGLDRTADRTFLYDEWDHHQARYVRAWCRVHEHRLRGDDFAFIGDVRRRHAVLASQVRRRFSFLRPEAWQRVHRTSDGDELELDALIEAVVDRRAGYTTDERLYMRRDRARREVATAFLVDLSASTGSPVVDPDASPPGTLHPDLVEYPYLALGEYDERPKPPPPRRAIDIAKESLALMGDAVHVLGDRHAIYGFSGMGHDKVEFYVAKEFDDDPSPRTWAALAAMEPRRYTRMGPAIRHATMKLASESVRTKLLIVVSDGYPQDSDYGPDPGDKEYGLQDTARALQEAETAGVATYCVTIDPAGNDYLRRMCPPHRYSVIDDVHALPGELAKLYRSLTTSR
jgi:nitric oxide reductase activation protein